MVKELKVKSNDNFKLKKEALVLSNLIDYGEDGNLPYSKFGRLPTYDIGASIENNLLDQEFLMLVVNHEEVDLIRHESAPYQAQEYFIAKLIEIQLIHENKEKLYTFDMLFLTIKRGSGYSVQINPPSFNETMLSFHYLTWVLSPELPTADNSKYLGLLTVPSEGLLADPFSIGVAKDYVAKHPNITVEAFIQSERKKMKGNYIPDPQLQQLILYFIAPIGNEGKDYYRLRKK